MKVYCLRVLCFQQAWNTSFEVLLIFLYLKRIQYLCKNQHNCFLYRRINSKILEQKTILVNALLNLSLSFTIFKTWNKPFFKRTVRSHLYNQNENKFSIEMKFNNSLPPFTDVYMPNLILQLKSIQNWMLQFT